MPKADHASTNPARYPRSEKSQTGWSRTAERSLPDRIQQDADLANCASMAGSYLIEAGIDRPGIDALIGLIDAIAERLEERSNEVGNALRGGGEA